MIKHKCAILLITMMAGLVGEIRARTLRIKPFAKDTFCKQSVGPPRNIDMYEGKSELVVAWDRPIGSRACNVSYQVVINVDSGAVANVRTLGENYPVIHHFEEDYCTVIEVVLRAYVNRIKSDVVSEEFMVGIPENCGIKENGEIDNRGEEEDTEIKRRILSDPFESFANVEMRALFDEDDKRNELIP